jgi:hypothetical protein
MNKMIVPAGCQTEVGIAVTDELIKTMAQAEESADWQIVAKKHGLSDDEIRLIDELPAEIIPDETGNRDIHLEMALRMYRNPRQETLPGIGVGEKVFLTPREAVALSGVAVWHFDRHRRQGAFKTYTGLASEWRFKRKEIVEFFESLEPDMA